MASVVERLARYRVPFGFLAGVIVLLLARPTWRSLLAGSAIAVAGEAVRIWAAGHLEKSREVTRSGPYRWTRHPLYVGSALLGAAVAVAGASPAAAGLIAVYLGATFSAAIRTEEAFLRAAFGREYDEYCHGAGAAVDRRFSIARAWRNREYRAVLGMAAVFAILLLKAILARG